MSKTSRHFKAALEHERRAKSLVNDSLDSCLHFQQTNTELDTALARVWDAPWYRTSPAWVHHRVSGYREGVIGSHYSLLERTLVFAHLYQGKLYRSFDEWRSVHPDLSGAELSDSCVRVWPNGKVYFAGLDGRKALEGQVFPFADAV
jgi:hypothetical protein